MASRLVSIFGLKRAGKDTLGDELVTAFNYTKFHFADNLRDILYNTNPWINTDNWYNGKIAAVRLQELVDDVGWEVAKADYPEVRRLMQLMGTEGCRAILGDHVWIDALERQIDQVDGPVVVTDGRFYNESRWVKSLGGTVVLMHRRWGIPQEEDTHLSEQELGLIVPDMDIIVEGGMDEVRSYAKRVNDLAKSLNE